MKYIFIIGIIVGPKSNSFLRLKKQLSEIFDSELLFVICRFGFKEEFFDEIPNEPEIFEYLIAPNKKSICEMRNEVQYRLAIKMKEFDNSIGFVLDEDLEVKELFINQENEFDFKKENLKELIIENKNKKIDASVGKITGDPPIPKSYCQSGQLKDIISILNHLLENDPNLNYSFPFCKLQAEIFIFPNLYHDILCLENKYEKVIDITKNKNIKNSEVFELILNGISLIKSGKSFTRNLIHHNNQNKITRGGAFIVYNPEVLLNAKNRSMIYKGAHSRRSDMIMIIEALKKGFLINTVQLPFNHSRESYQYESEPTKVLMDCIGHALVYSQNGGIFINELKVRINLSLENVKRTQVLTEKIRYTLINIKNNLFSDILSNYDLEVNRNLMNIDNSLAFVKKELEEVELENVLLAYKNWNL